MIIHEYAKYTSNSFQFSQTFCARGALVKLHRFQTPAIKGQHGACSSGEAGDLRFFLSKLQELDAKS